MCVGVIVGLKTSNRQNYFLFSSLVVYFVSVPVGLYTRLVI